MELIELLVRFQENKRELRKVQEKMTMIEKEMAMVRKEIADFCKTTENYEVILGPSICNGIAQAVKNAKYVYVFSSRLFTNRDFTDLVRGKRYGLFMSDSDFAPVVKFVGFNLLDHPDEYEKGRKVAKKLAKQGEIIVMFDNEIVFEKMD
jgi:hypothetical protein